MSLYTELNLQGVTIAKAIFSTAEIAELIAAINRLPLDNAYGERAFLQRYPELADALMTPRFAALLNELLPNTQSKYLIKSLYFDKPPQANWTVPWHQDLTIHVQEKRETAGFSHWRIKPDSTVVQPPINLLQNMVTTRIHLDDCRADNGALRVIKGSHQHGIIPMKGWQADSEACLCETDAGSVLCMKPLTLHASHRNNHHKRRRVIHIEWSPCDLPNGLQWQETQPI